LIPHVAFFAIVGLHHETLRFPPSMEAHWR
jgi:hypothetical protein